MTFEERPKFEETKAFHTAFSRWLSRGEEFGVLIEMESFDVERSDRKKTAKLRNDWIAENRDKIRQYCSGIAIVTDSQSLLHRFKPLTKHLISKMYGCSGVMVSSRTEARDWLDDHVPLTEDSNVRMDRGWRLLLGMIPFAVVLGAWAVSPEPVLSWLSWLAADPLRFGLVLCLFALVRPLFMWPTMLPSVAVGYGYGIIGLPFALVLTVFTSVLPYLYGRRARSVTPRIERWTTGGERFVDSVGTLRSVIASRLLPAPSDIVAVSIGSANVGLGTFVLGTAIGALPWAFAGVLVGSAVQSPSTEAIIDVFDPRLMMAASLAVVLLFAGRIYRRVRR